MKRFSVTSTFIAVLNPEVKETFGTFRFLFNLAIIKKIPVAERGSMGWFGAQTLPPLDQIGTLSACRSACLHLSELIFETPGFPRDFSTESALNGRRAISGPFLLACRAD
jgi:hypothetical protein